MDVKSSVSKEKSIKKQDHKDLSKLNGFDGRLCGVVNISREFANAYLLEIDISSLEIDDENFYYFLRRFYRMCRNYRHVVPFRHPVKTAYTPEELEGMDVMEDKRDYAITAIDQYNNVTQEGKLKLERLIMVTCVNRDGNDILYMTFYAIDMETSTPGVYQAAMAEHNGQLLLGLLKDFSNNKILAVLSVKDTIS